MKKLMLLFFCNLLISLAFGGHEALATRMWQRIEIPGARCGLGGPYYAFVDIKANAPGLAVIFEGGGACWDYLTCKTGIATNLKSDLTVANIHGIVSPSHSNSPVADWSMVYLPYCTGDMFAGGHTAKYFAGFSVKHVGKTNVQKAFDYLKLKGHVDWQSPSRLLIYGVSAGALGAMINLPWIEKNHTREGQDKVVLLDGLGAHWNKHVWKRFTDRRMQELVAGLDDLGIPFKPEEGPLAQYAVNVCQRFPQYRFGVMQGTMDIVMGTFFGLMTPLSHRKMVLGSQGIYQTSLDPDDNCAAWLHESPIHTFMEGGTPGLHLMQSQDGTSAFDFSHRVIYQRAGTNHR